MGLFSRITHHASCAVVACVACSLAGEGAADWQDALRVIRTVALDKSEPDEHRANAVLAYTRMQMRRGQPDEALQLCQEILKGFAEKSAVAEAALRAGGLVQRARFGNLKAEMDFLSPWAVGSQGQTAYGMVQELNRATYMLGALAGRPMVPAPVTARLPHWAEAAPGRAPSALGLPPSAVALPGWYPKAPDKPPEALRLALPRFEPPHWHSRLAFPPLKEPKAERR